MIKSKQGVSGECLSFAFSLSLYEINQPITQYISGYLRDIASNPKSPVVNIYTQ